MSDIAIFFIVFTTILAGIVFWMGEHVEHKDDSSKK